ncbi:hypothetical protein ACWGKQ_11100 [Streptomyces sp. NPDC054770]
MCRKATTPRDHRLPGPAEHVFVLGEEFRQSLPQTWDEQQRTDDAVTRPASLTPG